jgi:signal transduction histidine kinase
MPILLRRATLGHLLLAVLLLTALAQAAAGVVLHRRMRGQLEADLGRRLVHVATLLTFSVDPPLVAQFRAGDETLAAYDLVRRRLAAQAEAAGVTRAYVLDHGDRTLVDTEAAQPPGRVRHALLARRSELAEARAGRAVATRLYADESGLPRLSAFAPLRDRAGAVVALVAVDAPPEFFSALDVLQSEMLLLGAVAVGLLVLAGTLVTRQVGALRRAEARARENARLAALGGLAGGLLHELGNPLAALAMYLDLLRPLAPAGEGQELVDRARREDDRLREFLEDFRVFAGLAPLRLSEVDLAAVGVMAAEPLTWPSEIARHTEGGGRVRADARLLAHALRNLLRNALEAGATRVDVRLSADGGEAEITVRDNGPGLAAAELERAQEPFHTTKPHGTGLGLLIARRVAEMHGGRLEADSAPGAGARFAIRWPREREEKKEDTWRAS